MVADIVFDYTTYILESSTITSGEIQGYSLDGDSYDFTRSTGENITIILS